MKTEGSLPHSQELSTSSYPEPEKEFYNFERVYKFIQRTYTMF
jgi:hypothetical protein